MASQILFSVLVLGILRAVTSQGPPPEHFYPINGQASSLTDDGSSPLITLKHPLMFFGKSYNQTYVNNNGHLTFDGPVDNFTPESFPLFGEEDIIAPLWSDLDVRDGGQITYNQYTNGSVLQQATQDINDYFPGLNFSAELVFVATWYKVPYYDINDTETTFQGVLISGGGYSFVLMNYESIAETDNSVEAGYDTIMSIHYESITSSISGNATGPNSGLSLGSNVGLSGRWVFRIDNGTRTGIPNGAVTSLGPPPEHFYPINGQASSLTDDGSSPLITLEHPLMFFGKSYNQTYVNNNGHLTFDAPLADFIPGSFPLFGEEDIIAPLWSDLDVRDGGQITYNQYTNGSVLQQATQDINDYFPGLNFSAELVFVATWYKVPYYDVIGTETTFQGVLISGGGYSFVLLNYESIAETDISVEAGYDTIMSIHYESITSSISGNVTGPNSGLSLGSNVGVTGRWAFRIDDGTRTVIPNEPLLPIEGQTNPEILDGSSPAISLLSPFYCYGRAYRQIYVNNNGHITFDAPWSSYTPQMFPLFGIRDVIAVCWGDFDIRQSGQVYYEQYTSGSILQELTEDINNYFPDLNFVTEWALVASWYKVPTYLNPGTQSTFQAILVTGGEYSFVILNYEAIALTNQTLQAGFDTVNSTFYFNVPGSFSDSSLGDASTFLLGSNVGKPGRWVFRTDNGTRDLNFDVFSGNLYPVFGRPSPRSLDGSSSAILLPSPFVYFGASYDEIYVNNNGHMTFGTPSSEYIPQMFPAEGNIDIIAPFWRDFNTRQTGHVFSRIYTDGIVLQQVTSDINQYFPGLNFNADWICVATWYEVAYFGDDRTQSTFQGVLIRGNYYSFLMLNYGNIATGIGDAQAGFDTINSISYYSIPGSFTGGVGNDRAYINDSNVGVPGRWVLRVDHGTRDCLSDMLMY